MLEDLQYVTEANKKLTNPIAAAATISVAVIPAPRPSPKITITAGVTTTDKAAASTREMRIPPLTATSASTNREHK
jgi:hypothetical protein